jgi:hypothetical protein
MIFRPMQEVVFRGGLMAEAIHSGSHCYCLCKKETMAEERYWIAINGASCAISRVPWIEPATIPVARQYIGFPTLQEAEKAHSVCLHGSKKEMHDYFKSLRADVMAGRIHVINPPNPQPPTQGKTAWMESKDALDILLPW